MKPKKLTVKIPDSEILELMTSIVTTFMEIHTIMEEYSCYMEEIDKPLPQPMASIKFLMDEVLGEIVGTFGIQESRPDVIVYTGEIPEA